MLSQKQKSLFNVLPVLIPVIGFCATPLMPAESDEYRDEVQAMVVYQEAQDINHILNDTDDAGFDLASLDLEQGALSLYVKAEPGMGMDDIAAQLNNVEPSVGVRYEMEF